MNEINVEFPKGTKIRVKGPSKFVILALVLIFVGIYLIQEPHDFPSLFGMVSAFSKFLLVGPASYSVNGKRWETDSLIIAVLAPVRRLREVAHSNAVRNDPLVVV
jgi:hypothetical protein